MSKLKAVEPDLTIITPKEREALEHFKKRIPDILEHLNDYKRHDLSIIRWLRARELDVDKAEEMLRKSMEWRDEEMMDKIFDWKIPTLVDDQLLLKVSGFDKNGCLIPIIPFGRWDIRSLVSVGLKYDAVRFADLLFQQAMRFAERRTTETNFITQFVIVLDLEGFSWWQLSSRETINAIMDILRRFEANHPETLKAAWIVNAPKIFEILFAIVKPLLSARTLSKVQVYGSNIEQWRPLLLENIDSDQLPSQYGGSNTSCKNYKVAYGFDVFPVLEELPENEFIPVTVQAASKHVVKFCLCKSNKLSWNFRTTNYNIGFSLKYSSANASDESAKGSEVLFEVARADSNIYLQKGAIVADKPGTYFLVFDNSFSRYHEKSLFYAVRIVPVNEATSTTNNN